LPEKPPLHFDPWAEAPVGSPADALIRLICLDYGTWHPSRLEKARAMLATQPELAGDSLHAAAAVGDVASVRAWLAREPALADARGGPFGWEPILYACYSRLDPGPGHSTLEAARLLLDAGAGPNARFLWQGLVPPFTALTGAFGGGEDSSHQPPHPQHATLARLLLDRGADPNDAQTLYNLHFQPNDDHLELLISYGLGPGPLLVEELWAAARQGYFDRVRRLVAHGTDVNTPGRRDGRTPYEAARRAGHTGIAEYLLERGARKVELGPEEAFAAACIAGHADLVRALLAEDPLRVEKLGRERRIELLHRAVEAKRLEAIRLMAELGFEIDGMATHDNVGMNLGVTPLHNAAWSGQLDMVGLLVQLGADPNVREATHHATPLGWAAHNRQAHVVEYLLPFATIFDAVQVGAVERAAELLRADPTLVHAVDSEGHPLAFHVHEAMPRRTEMLALLRGYGLHISDAG
jgi:ankyrin repeat protein